MKRLTTTLAALGFASCSAIAALPASTDPTLVSVPQLPGGFVFSGTAYYLQPSDTHGDLDYASVNSGTSPNFFSSLKSVEPGYHWGWSISEGYIIPHTGNDVNLSYFHLDTEDKDSVTVSPGSNITIPVFDDQVNADIVNGNSKAEYNWDVIDLTAGQFIDVGCRLVIHPFTGLRYSRLERQLDNHYITTTPTPPLLQVTSNIDNSEESIFSGIGPLAGIDASYYLGRGLGIVGHFDSGVLVGNIDSRINNTITINTAQPIILNHDFDTNTTRRVVPVTDAKLGADYTWLFNNVANSDLTMELGWQVSHYYNAVDKLGVAIGQPGRITQRVTSDVGLSGPYASLVLHI